MLDKNRFLDNLDRFSKIQLSLKNKNKKDVTDIISFFEKHKKKYGVLDVDLSEYGCLYLKTFSKDQRRAFIEDFFSKSRPEKLRNIVDLEYIETRNHIPEKSSLICNESFLAYFSDLVKECKTKLDLSNSQPPDQNMVNIAIIDSGIDYTHSKLSKKFDLANVGKNFVQDIVHGVEPLPVDKPLDQKGHGTHIAGIIIKESPNIRVYSLKVLDQRGAGDPDYLLKALKWCKTKNIDLINLSIGGYKYNSYCEKELADLPDKTIVIAAAGNEGLGVSYPAHYPRVISVGSVNACLEHSDFSNLWNSVDVSAEGENTTSTYPFEGYAILSGTSMATAAVTSVIASGLSLLRKNNKNWVHSDIECILKKSVVRATLNSSLEKLVNTFGLLSNKQAKEWAYGKGVVTKKRFLAKLKKEYNL